MRTALISLSIFLLGSCIKYSFTGSTLPPHIKVVSIPLVENATSEIGLEERVRESVYQTFASANLFQLTETGGNAELRVRIASFQNTPDEYDAGGNVKTYRVIIEADVDFLDLVENNSLFKGRVRGVGVYSHTTETRETGVDNALKKLNEVIVNNTISGW